MKYNPELNKYYSMRQRIGAFFSHIGGCNFYLKLVERIATKYDETGWKGVLSSISYTRGIFVSELFTNLITGKFCGVEVLILANYNRYLKKLYGDASERKKRGTHCV